MLRLLTGVLLSVLAGLTAIGQSHANAATDQSQRSAQPANSQSYKAEMLRSIALNEAAMRAAEASHAHRKRLAAIDANLGILYQDAGMFQKSENAIQRAIVLLQDGPQDQLAAEVERLAVLHLAMNKTRQAEEDEMRDMRIRETIADPVGIALAQSALAGLYDEERKFAKALPYAQESFAVLADRAGVSVADRIGARQTLGIALTGTRSCARGIAVLNDAVELAKRSPGVDNERMGYSEFVLGSGYWHCGDRGHAAEWLQRGTTDMRAGYGWDQAMYLNAMRQYARFLRENGQQQAADSAEAVVHQAEGVVDAGALTGRAAAFRSAGTQ